MVSGLFRAPYASHLKSRPEPARTIISMCMSLCDLRATRQSRFFAWNWVAEAAERRMCWLRTYRIVPTFLTVKMRKPRYSRVSRDEAFVKGLPSSCRSSQTIHSRARLSTMQDNSEAQMARMKSVSWRSARVGVSCSSTAP